MWHTVQCLKLYLRCSVSVHSSKNTRTQDIFKTLIVLLSKMVLNFAQSFFLARIKLVRIRWLQNTTRFSFPSSPPPPAFLIPLFNLPVTKRAPFPIWTVWNAGLLLKPQYVLQQGLEGDPDPAILLFFFHDVVSSRTSVISIPDTVFFPNTASRTKILANPAFRKGKRGQIPNPVKTFCVFPNPAL